MRRSIRVDRRKAVVTVQPEQNKVITAIVEIKASDLKINLIGEHCPHCKTSIGHLLKLDNISILDH